jgi:hypothetical protein
MSHQRDDADEFVKRCRRIAFIATPHSGSDLATWGDRLRIIIQPSVATACLARNDPNLRDLNLWYREWSEKHSGAHLILTESQAIRIAGIVVKPESSDPGLPSRPISIDANHLTICKPKDRSSEIYLHIRSFIERQLETGYRETVIVETLRDQQAQLKKLSDSVASSAQKYPKELVDVEIKKHLSTMRRARFFRGFPISDYAIRLAERIRSGELEGGSDNVKSNALAWCARVLAVGENSAQSVEFLNLACQLGNGPEITIAEAFRISANGDLEGALSKLAGVASPNARAAAFLIVTNLKDAASAIEWLSKSGITHSDLDAVGKFFLIMRLLELSHWDTALEYAGQLREEDFLEAPILFHAAAIAHLVQSIPDEIKSIVLRQVPLEVYSFPLASDQTSLRARRKAQELFSKCVFVAKEFGCNDAANIADDYALWLELRDPEGLNSGLEKLRSSMRESAHSLRRLHFALQFGLKLDLDAVEREIEQRTALSGGSSADAALARFSLSLTQKNPKDVADYIDRHRDQIQKYIEKKFVGFTEIEMLAKAGLAKRAEERFMALVADGLSDAEQAHLRRIIAESTGIDPIEARKAQFEGSGQLHDLVNLVNLLEEQRDWPQLCHFGSMLFEKTKSLSDAERLAKALNQACIYDDLSALLRKYPEFLDQSDTLQMFWSWALYREGSFAEAASALDKLRAKRDDPNDRILQVNLAIDSGNWESLLPYVEKEWVNRDKREADDLIRTAQLAQFAGSPRAKELVYAATAKGANNAGILMAAYFLATSAGCENEGTVAQWLHNAAELSDNSGPIHKMSMKDVLDQAPEWNRRASETWQNLQDGNLPIFVAARFLNRTLVDMFLLPALTNPSEQDPRKRPIVPAYSGVRQPLPCNYQVVAMEGTALLTLGFLGLLEKASESFENIVIPHSTFRWLFLEKKEVSFHQPSRIKDALKLMRLISNGTLKVFTGSATIDPDLSAEVGEELASLIAEAQTGNSGDDRQRLVIRSSPVHCIGSLMEEEADLSSYYAHLCSCLAVVNKLKQKGQLTTTEESHARSYLSLQEKDWPRQPEISDGAVLYLDDLSVTYLQHTGLLIKLQSAGLEAYISVRKKEELNALLRYDQLSSEVGRVIETIRSFLTAGIRGGKIKVGKIPPLNKTVDQSLLDHPTSAILDLSKDVEAIFVDDRFFNQHSNVDNGSGLTPILTTLDFIDALLSKGNITLNEMLDYRTMLRRASYFFVPITRMELERHLADASVAVGRIVETAELKAIRENILQMRMSRFLQLPKEAPLLHDLMQTLSYTLRSQWCPEIDETTAGARSEWLLKLLDLRGWAHCFNSDGGLYIGEHIYGAQILSLLMAPSTTTESKAKYLKWVEEHLLIVIREENPQLYSWMIKRAQELIATAVSIDISKENE